LPDILDLCVSCLQQVQPAYLARVQQHLEFEASTRLHLPASEGVVAGLVACQVGRQLANRWTGICVTGLVSRFV